MSASSKRIKIFKALNMRKKMRLKVLRMNFMNKNKFTLRRTRRNLLLMYKWKNRTWRFLSWEGCCIELRWSFRILKNIMKIWWNSYNNNPPRNTKREVGVMRWGWGRGLGKIVSAKTLSIEIDVDGAQKPGWTWWTWNTS